jgi:hypothetical protein
MAKERNGAKSRLKIRVFWARMMLLDARNREEVPNQIRARTHKIEIAMTNTGSLAQSVDTACASDALD